MISVSWTVLFFFFLRKQKSAAARNARKNAPPTEMKTITMTVGWWLGDGGSGGSG